MLLIDIILSRVGRQRWEEDSVSAQRWPGKLARGDQGVLPEEEAMPGGSPKGWMGSVRWGRRYKWAKGEQVSKRLGSREIPQGREGTTDTCVGGDWPGDLTRQQNSQTCTSACSRKSFSRTLMPYHFLPPQMSKPIVHTAPPKAKGCPQPPWCPLFSECLSTWGLPCFEGLPSYCLRMPQRSQVLGR